MVIFEFLTKKTSNNELTEYRLKAHSTKEALAFVRGWKAPDEFVIGKPTLILEAA